MDAAGGLVDRTEKRAGRHRKGGAHGHHPEGSSSPAPSLAQSTPIGVAASCRCPNTRSLRTATEPAEAGAAIVHHALHARNPEDTRRGVSVTEIAE